MTSHIFYNIVDLEALVQTCFSFLISIAIYTLTGTDEGRLNKTAGIICSQFSKKLCPPADTFPCFVDWQVAR